MKVQNVNNGTDNFVYFKILSDLCKYMSPQNEYKDHDSEILPTIQLYTALKLRKYYNIFGGLDEVNMCRYNVKERELQIITNSDCFIYSIVD